MDLDPLGLTLALRHLAALGTADSGCQVGGGAGQYLEGEERGSGQGAALCGGGGVRLSSRERGGAVGEGQHLEGRGMGWGSTAAGLQCNKQGGRLCQFVSPLSV